jgi:hypothetical protein
VVIFEGGGDSDFDQRVTSTLFPEILEQANLVSGSNKIRVRALHETLETASQKGQLPFKFFAITDKDSDSQIVPAKSVNIFSWDVYHIENYFLEPKYIAKVLSALQVGNALTEEAIWDELRQSADDSLPQLIRHELSVYANQKLVNSINTGTDPKAADLSGVLFDAASRSVERVRAVFDAELTAEALEKKVAEAKTRYLESIANGTWISTVRGRDILKKFAGKHAPLVSYEVFRNLIISHMKDDGYKPAGMATVVNQILNT